MAPPLAGVAGLDLGRFLALTGFGTILWAGSAVAAGALFHRTVDRFLDALSSLGTAAAYVLGAGLALYVGAKWWRRHLFVRQLRMARIRPDELYRKRCRTARCRSSSTSAAKWRGGATEAGARLDRDADAGEFDARIALLAGAEDSSSTARDRMRLRRPVRHAI